MTRRFAALLSSLLLLAPLSLSAGQLTVAPIRLHMSPTQPNATFTLTNGANQEGFYQLQLFAWDQEEGESTLRQQQELVVTPPVTMIPANSEQVVRVVRQRPTDTKTEKSYRLVISEVPDKESDNGAQLQVLLRISVPVFVGTEDQTHALTAAYRDGQLVIRNSGNAHARLADAFWDDDQGKRHTLHSGLAGYVLPNRYLPMELPSSQGAKVRNVSFTVNGNPATLSVEHEQ